MYKKKKKVGWGEEGHAKIQDSEKISFTKLIKKKKVMLFSNSEQHLLGKGTVSGLTAKYTSA